MNNFYQSSIQWSKKNSIKSAGSKIKITTISILLGLIFGLIVIAILGYNPFTVYSNVFKFAFQSKSKVNTLLIYTSIFALAGLANAFAFKTGVFNIGVPGQMIAGGGTAMALALTVFRGVDPAIAIPILLLITILVAGLIGLLVGALKSYFNVHEVVSTILLNWIIFYLFKYIFRPSAKKLVSITGDSHYINRNIFLGGNGNNAWVSAIIIVLVISTMIFLILKFTTYGRSIKMTGLNHDGAKNAGINIRFSIISSLFISAAIGGLLGFVYYFGKQHFFEKLNTSLPTYGFDGIAIAILAFNSPLVIPLISFMYGILQNGAGGAGLPSGIQNETISLIFSIIIYFSAISTLFIGFRPIQFLKTYIRLKQDAEAKIIINESNKICDLIKAEENEEVILLNNDIKELRNNINTINKNKNKKQILKEELKIKLSLFKNKIFNNVIKKSKNSINTTNKKQILKKELKIKLSLLDDQNNLLNQRMKSVKKEALIRAVELIKRKENNIQTQNYMLTKNYLTSSLRDKFKNQINVYLLNFSNTKNNFKSKQEIKDINKKEILSLKEKHKSQKIKSIKEFEILKQKLIDKKIKKAQFISKIDLIIQKEVK